jgi:hypothetical protein
LHEPLLQHYDLDEHLGHFTTPMDEALVTALVALGMGVWQFDTSVARLGAAVCQRGHTLA